MALYLCLSVSVRSRTITKMAERIQLVFLWEPPSTYATLRKFGYFQNNGIFYWKSVPNSGLRKFFFAHEICQFQQSSSTVEFFGVTDDGRCVVAVYYTSVSRNL